MHSVNKFNTSSVEEVRTLIDRAAKKLCPIDPMPTTFGDTVPGRADSCTGRYDQHLSPVRLLRREVEGSSIYAPSEKAGLEQTKENLLPVSNLVYVSKLTESAAATQLENHVLENGTLYISPPIENSTALRQHF